MEKSSGSIHKEVIALKKKNLIFFFLLSFQIHPNFLILFRDPWTDEENEMILKSILNSGKKWSKISKQLNGRPENSIKNHYIKLLSQHKIEKNEDNDSPEFRQKLTALLEKFTTPLSTVKNQPESDQKPLSNPKEKNETPLKISTVTASEILNQILLRQNKELSEDTNESSGMSHNLLNCAVSSKPDSDEYSPTIKLQYQEKQPPRNIPCEPYLNYPADYYSYPNRTMPMMYPMMEPYSYPYQPPMGMQYPPQYGAPPFWPSGRYPRVAYYPVPNPQASSCSHSHKCCNHTCWES